MPSYADAPTEVYVQTPANGGDDLNFPTCSQVLPCATVPSALNAVADGGTIHVGPGTFDGWVNLGARGIAVTISGDSAAGTILTASSTSASGYDGTVVEAYADVHTTLAHLSVSGDGDDAGVLAYSGSQLGLDDVVVDGGDCAVAVFNAAVDLTDSTLQHGGGASCSGGLPVSGDLGFTGGTVNLTRTQILDPAVGAAGVDMQGGTLTADQSFFDDSGHPLDTNNSKGLKVTAGTATVTRSTFHNWGFQAVDVDSGTTTLSDDTFQGNLVAVYGDGGFDHRGAEHLPARRRLAPGHGLGCRLRARLGARSPPSGIQECNGSDHRPGLQPGDGRHLRLHRGRRARRTSVRADLNLTDGSTTGVARSGSRRWRSWAPAWRWTRSRPARRTAARRRPCARRRGDGPAGRAATRRWRVRRRLDGDDRDDHHASPGRRRRSHTRTSRSKPRSGRPR